MEKDVKTIKRALDILECFSGKEKGLTLAEITNKLKIPKPTIHRIVTTLCSYGYLYQDENQHYMLGLKLLNLSSLVNSSISIRNVAYPYMKQLGEETGESVDLNILDKYERICLEKIESVHQLRNFIKVGERNTLMYGASGKVLLAFQSEEYLYQTFEYYKIDETDFQTRFCNQIAEVKQKGYAITVGERVQEAFGIAVPIYDYNGKVHACVTLSGPAFRLAGKESSHIEKVIRTAKEISVNMGYIEKG